jgi:RecA/RadA recombinase
MADKKPSLMERLQKVSTVNEAAVYSESKLLQTKDLTPTEIPLLNVALAGAFDGGLGSGVHVIAGPSKHFKSLFGLLMVKAYMDKYPDAVMIMIDSEFGTPPSYLKNMGIDPTRVLHIPVTTVEQARHELSVQLKEITRSDNVIFFFDSLGNLASDKETQDALDGKEAADMTRAKVIKSLFRIITPQLNLKDIPMLVVNHTYQTQEKYSKAVVSGGTGVTYSANGIWIIGREQEKEGDELVGYTFGINVEKSRYVRERSKLKITVTFEGGIDKYSGIFDLACEANLIKVLPSGWYNLCHPETGELSEKKYRRAELDTPKIMGNMIKLVSFQNFVKQRYQLETPKSFEEMMAEADADEGPQILTEEGGAGEEPTIDTTTAVGKQKAKKK